jgi:hypothetical protein
MTGALAALVAAAVFLAGILLLARLMRRYVSARTAKPMSEHDAQLNLYGGPHRNVENVAHSNHDGVLVGRD